MADKKFDGYPKLDEETKKWFSDIIDGMVSKPDSARPFRRKEGLDLEMVILVADEDRNISSLKRCVSPLKSCSG
jgi:hypothetical protein